MDNSQHSALASGPEKKFFDAFYSEKELGCSTGKLHTTFRLFAPRATGVTLVIFDRYDDASGTEHAMRNDGDGIWEHTVPQALLGSYYGYRVSGPAGRGEMFDPSIVIADPYSKAVVTQNSYHHPAKTLILDTSYDWQGDTVVLPSDHNRLVIYEAHLRDLTADPSSGVSARGTYRGLMEAGRVGGLSHLKELGVNAIEFLPLQKFGTIEIPFRDGSVAGEGFKVNTWNPYERNHWGYMTSFFFAPETYYASDGTMEHGVYIGTDGRAVREFKDLIRSLHREGIAVIMDVVYNHVSQYDRNPFRYVDKFYYFHCDSEGNFFEQSGCGNDFRTDRPMSRRLITDSITYWMKEYHIDGFRFDLATMIDPETCWSIAAEAKKINPKVILIAEPWGGGKYDLAGFSNIGWAAWNDRFRDGVKGKNPGGDPGFIFGKFCCGNSKRSFMSYLTGSVRKDGGPFLCQEHSVNYLESHDDYTLGDFIRLAENQHPPPPEGGVLSGRELALNKLAAMFLLSSQGPVMIAEGQEFARSKVIADAGVPDPAIGTMDSNSYNKDNATNYLNYRHREMNRGLFEYYQGLIQLRRKHEALGSASRKDIRFLKTASDLVIALKIRKTGKSGNDFIVILNGDPATPAKLRLPQGTWTVAADAERVSPEGASRTVSGGITIPPSSGLILMGG